MDLSMWQQAMAYSGLEIEMRFKIFELHGFRIHIVRLIQWDHRHGWSHLTWNQVVVKATDFVDVSILDWLRDGTLSSVDDDLVVITWSLRPVMDMCCLAIICDRHPIPTTPLLRLGKLGTYSKTPRIHYLVLKVSGPTTNTFSSTPTSHRISKQTISTRWLANLNRGHVHFLRIFGAHMNILFIVKVKILFLVKRSNGSPRFYWPLRLCWQILDNVSFWCSFLDPHLSAHHLNIRVRSR